MRDERALRQFLAQHDGVVTRKQARDCGLSDSAISRRVASGVWTAVGPGVFAPSDRQLNDASRARIAVASGGPGAALAGMSAAWWHGLVESLSYPVHVVVPHGRNGKRVRGAKLWHRTVAKEDLSVVRDLRVTATPITVLDAAVRGGIAVLDSALLRKRVSMSELVDAQRRNVGRRGSPNSRQMLELMSLGARSEGERVLVALLRASGLRGWSTNHPVLGYLLDIAFAAVKVFVEVDGFAFHTDLAAFQRDRTRQNALVAAGWTVLRFTWYDLTEHPDDVIAQIRRRV